MTNATKATTCSPNVRNANAMPTVQKPESAPLTTTGVGANRDTLDGCATCVNLVFMVSLAARNVTVSLDTEQEITTATHKTGNAHVKTDMQDASANVVTEDTSRFLTVDRAIAISPRPSLISVTLSQANVSARTFTRVTSAIVVHPVTGITRCVLNAHAQDPVLDPVCAIRRRDGVNVIVTSVAQSATSARVDSMVTHHA